MNALDRAAFCEETELNGHHPLLSLPPAHTWQGEMGNAEAVRASLTERAPFPLSKPLHAVQDKAAVGTG